MDVLLAELGLDQETVRACKTGNPLNDEEAVQDGLIRWKEGQGKKQPPTWAVLVEAMDFAGIDQSNIRDLKRELGVLKGVLFVLVSSVCTETCGMCVCCVWLPISLCTFDVECV